MCNKFKFCKILYFLRNLYILHLYMLDVNPNSKTHYFLVLIIQKKLEIGIVLAIMEMLSKTSISLKFKNFYEWYITHIFHILDIRYFVFQMLK